MRKRYWLRGAIIGFVVTMITLIVFKLASPCEGFCISFRYFWMFLIGMYASIGIGGAILGAFFGWLYGIIKNRSIHNS